MSSEYTEDTIVIHYLKVLVPIHNLIPSIFFKDTEILVPEVESYLEGFVCEVVCAKSVYFLGEIRENPLGNEKTWLPYIIKIISDIYKYCFCFVLLF